MSLLKKFYPRSPEPYIGKRLGDNYVAKLADINELIAQIEELYANTPPGSGLSSVAVDAPLTGTGTIGDPITLSGSVAGTDFDVESTGSGITIAKNTGTYGTGPLNFSAGDLLKIQVQSIPNGLNWQGEHNSATAYQLNDVVYKVIGSTYYTYWCKNPSGASAPNSLPSGNPPAISNTNWAQLGLQGPAGTNGATWNSGATPTGGVEGDFFLATSGVNIGNVYKKGPSSYGSALFNIIGATGATGSNGATWLAGTAAPNVAPGVVGSINDLYLQSTGVVWKKTGAGNTAWSNNFIGQVINLKGDTGPVSTVPGPTGSQGPAGPTNTVVRLYQRTATTAAPSVATANNTTYTFANNTATGLPSGWTTTIPASGNTYIWEIQAVASNTGSTATIPNSTWSTPALIAAPGAQGNAGTAATVAVGTVTSLAAGSTPTVTNSGSSSAATFNFGIPAGAAGSPGTDGKTIRNGTGAPASGLGNDGDFYIDTNADAIYGPKSGSAWGSATPLVGPQGPAGTAPTVIAFTVDGYGAPIILTAPGKTVFRVTLPFKATYQVSGLSVTSDLAVGTANGATLTVTGSGGGATGGPFTSAFATVAATSGTNNGGAGPIVFTSAGGTLTFNLSAPTAAMTYIYVNLSGTRD